MACRLFGISLFNFTVIPIQLILLKNVEIMSFTPFRMSNLECITVPQQTDKRRVYLKWSNFMISPSWRQCLVNSKESKQQIFKTIIIWNGTWHANHSPISNSWFCGVEAVAWILCQQFSEHLLKYVSLLFIESRNSSPMYKISMCSMGERPNKLANTINRFINWSIKRSKTEYGCMFRLERWRWYQWTPETLLNEARAMQRTPKIDAIMQCILMNVWWKIDYVIEYFIW